MHRLGEGARDRGHVQGKLEVPERLGDVLELWRPLDADVSNAAHDLPGQMVRVLYTPCKR